MLFYSFSHPPSSCLSFFLRCHRNHCCLALPISQLLKRVEFAFHVGDGELYPKHLFLYLYKNDMGFVIDMKSKLMIPSLSPIWFALKFLWMNRCSFLCTHFFLKKVRNVFRTIRLVKFWSSWGWKFKCVVWPILEVEWNYKFASPYGVDKQGWVLLWKMIKDFLLSWEKSALTLFQIMLRKEKFCRQS